MAGHPTAADILLIIEVSDTKLGFDREVKMSLYARAGVPEVWIVDLLGEQVSVYSRPANGFYVDAREVERGASIDLLMLPGLTVSVDDILG